MSLILTEPRAAEPAATEPSARRFNLRRIARHPALMEYRRLVVLVAAVNLLVFWLGLESTRWWAANGFVLDQISNLVLINLSLGILIRQQRVINLLFRIATSVPTNWPLRVRWLAGKIFHHGGLHSGGTVVGTVWFGFLLYAMAWNFSHGVAGVSAATLGITGTMLALMVLMIVSALAPLRARFHNCFELIHRCAGWTVLALFWAQTVSIIVDTDGSIIQSAAFWMLCILTLSVASPWMALKKVPIDVVKPSNHAVAVRFGYGDTPWPGSSNAISVSPWREWHSFANIPKPGEDGYRLVISRAGDWTGRFIDNPPSHVWVKGITTSGVAQIEVLFKQVVYIATGSGIGPVIPHLLAHDVPVRLIWSTRSPRKTYGDALVDEILEANPHAMIWDTDSSGKPDLSRLALDAVREFDAEAVICISNQKLTRRVVHDVESAGVPAFGAIWDS